jgi:ssDNA-binding replication factor A large subunit
MKTQEEIEQLAESEYGTEIGSIRGSNPYDLEKDRKNGYIKGYTQCQEDNSTSKVTRVEVVDETGRVYTKWNCSIELSYQDDGRTLKVFVK